MQKKDVHEKQYKKYKKQSNIPVVVESGGTLVESIATEGDISTSISLIESLATVGVVSVDVRENLSPMIMMIEEFLLLLLLLLLMIVVIVVVVAVVVVVALLIVVIIDIGVVVSLYDTWLFNFCFRKSLTYDGIFVSIQILRIT